MIFDRDKLANFNYATPFFVFSKKALLDNLKLYKKNLPGKTEICYAMKANSEKIVLEILNKKSVSFEVASKYELALLKEIKVPAKRIIYGTSVKPESHIEEFVKYGVDRFAFDSEQELMKIAKFAPGSRVYVRALVEDKSDSVFTMSKKFGADLSDAHKLMIKAKALGLKPYGISFNVGSQARNEHAWARGIGSIGLLMKKLMDDGINIQIVNLGGGFPFTYRDNEKFPNIEKISKHIIEATKKLPYRINFIAEPGRGLVANTFVLVTSVIGKNPRPNGRWLYLDAGVYNAMMESIASQGSTHYLVEPLAIKNSQSKKENFILTGPTGDNIDVINKKEPLPKDIESGDKLLIRDVGAYTFPLITKFNGFPKPKIIVL
jgi:ornithine decarboxylase